MPRLSIGGSGGISFAAANKIYATATPLSAATSAALSRMSTKPSLTVQYSLDNLIKGMNSIGIWSTTDILLVPMPGATEQAVQRNLKQDLYNATPTGTFTFDAVNGCYSGDGTSGRLDLGLNLGTAVGLNFTQNNGSISFWPLTGGAASSYIGGVDKIRLGAPNTSTSAGATFGAESMRFSSTTTRSTAATVLQPFDLHTYNRSSSTEYSLMVGALPVATWADTSAAFDSSNFTLLGNQAISNYTASKLGLFHMGASMTKHQQIQFRYLVRKYMMSVGIVTDTSSVITNNSAGMSIIGDTTKTFITQNASKSYSIKRDGNYFRFEVRNGDFWSGDTGNDRNRSEVYSSSRWGYSSDVWVSYAVRLPAECEVTPANVYLLLGQMHEDDSVQASPAAALIIQNNNTIQERIQFRRLWDATATVPPAYNQEMLYQDTQTPVLRDKIFNIVMRLRYKQDGTGVYQVWINGVQVVDKTNTNLGYAADVSAGAYPKFGIYRGLSTITSVAEFWNYELSATSLASRITNPLPIII